jgi:hypothetical protein
MTCAPGHAAVPLPEGDRYAGFVFATGDDPEAVTATLRRAGALIEVVVDPACETAAD